MAGKLDREEVRRWLRGQKAAQEITERERAKSLRERSHEESLRIYLDLK